jgi:hypothetical protein
LRTAEERSHIRKQVMEKRKQIAQQRKESGSSDARQAQERSGVESNGEDASQEGEAGRSES